MPQCFGDGKCITKGGYGYHNGYQKLYRCRYNCKLMPCFYCREISDPYWVLEKNAGMCIGCQKLKHNEKMMNKIFQFRP